MNHTSLGLSPLGLTRMQPYSVSLMTIEKINEEYQQRKELLGRDTTSKKGDDDDHESGTANYSSGSGDPPPHSSSSLGAGTQFAEHRIVPAKSRG